MPKQLYRVVSLFCGCGGMDLGFENAGFNIVWANDILDHALSTYKLNFNGTPTSNKDILTIDYRSIPDCEVVIGGFPCQDFSMLSKRNGINSARGNLYKAFVDIVKTKNPKVFIAENVKGLLSANDGKAIKTIIADFANKGYTVIFKLFRFANYGIPQIRERVIIVGIRKDLDANLWVWPAETHIGKHVSSKQALNGVENIIHNNEIVKHTKKTIERIAAIPAGGNFMDLPKNLKIKGMMSGIYRRLDPNKPSTTIIGNGGGGTHGYHYKYPRALTNRERARLQTFPDTFIFSGTNNEIRTQIGNAVPPLGAKIIAEKVKDFLISLTKKSNQESE